jgi:hypothetical protein
MIYKEEIQKSKTPNIIIRKKRKEQKEQKEKKDVIRFIRTPLKTVKKANNLDTSKSPSHITSTSNNINKNKKYQLKRALTPSERMRNKKITNRRPIELRVKLFAIKDENKILSKLIDNNEIIKTIASFLDEETQYNLFSCNKKFSKYLLEKFKTKKLPIKTVLLDQTIFCGLGNIYANEVLFACSINPYTPANELSIEYCQNIIDNSRDILKRATEAGGTTIRSYTSQLGVKGSYQDQLKVHSREKMPCLNCGEKIICEQINGRSAYYCPKCQKR